VGKLRGKYGESCTFGHQNITSMATINFLIKAKTENATIYVRLKDGKTDVTTSTGQIINAKDWSFKKKEPKQTATNKDKINIENKLSSIKEKIKEKLNSDKGTGIAINKEWLSYVVSLALNPKLEEQAELYLSDAMNDYMNSLSYKTNRKTFRPIAKSTLNSYKATINRLLKFENATKKKYKVTDIDLVFHDKFTKHLVIDETLAPNTINKSIKQIKTVCLDLRDKGIEINRNVESKKFQTPGEPTVVIPLLEHEILKIKNFKGSDHLENARDWLIIGCWTGCRVSDLMSLTIDNIQMNKLGQRFIRYKQRKTGKTVDVPIHSDVEEIIERLGNFPRPISDQKFNTYIKTVCRESGITKKTFGHRTNPKTKKKESGTFEKWELIRSHTCRRSFATNHYKKLPNKLIMAVTGHSTEQMFLAYIGETENDHLGDFISLWGQSTTSSEKVFEINPKRLKKQLK
jgi:integrase